MSGVEFQDSPPDAPPFPDLPEAEEIEIKEGAGPDGEPIKKGTIRIRWDNYKGNDFDTNPQVGAGRYRHKKDHRIQAYQIWSAIPVTVHRWNPNGSPLEDFHGPTNGKVYVRLEWNRTYEVVPK